MSYTVTKQQIQVLGYLWMPSCLAATCLTLYGYDMENLGDPTDRDAVENWIGSHSGDFSQVLDFRADFHIEDKHIVHEWAREDSACEYDDCMYPSED